MIDDRRTPGIPRGAGRPRVRAEVTERVGGRVIIIDSAAPTRNGGVASLKVDVPAGGKVSKSFTVVVDNS